MDDEQKKDDEERSDQTIGIDKPADADVEVTVDTPAASSDDDEAGSDDE